MVPRCSWGPPWCRRRRRVRSQDHDPIVPKDPGVQLLFEFLLYLIRKWFPDAYGAHLGVSRSGVLTQDHDLNVPKGVRVQVLFEFLL